MTATESDRRLGQLAVLPDPSGLLAGILSAPEEDTPRLLYADWLDEEAGRATERAEYIRWSIKASRGTVSGRGEKSFGNYWMLWQRLFLPLLDGWGANKGRNQTGESSPHMDRGFLSKIACSWEDWLRHGDALRAREWCPKVKLTNQPTIEALSVYHNYAEFNYAGRPKRTFIPQGGLAIEAATGKDMLATEWPGTEFDLPG
jgi:uncharacterized protein (TIGR02996 family)